MTDLTDRSVIITGAAQGIGATYAEALAKAGARVAVCDRIDPAAVVQRIQAAGGQAMGAAFDITDAPALAAFVADVQARFGRIDGLVNNAAIFATLTPGSFMDIDPESFDRVMQVNVRGTFDCIKAVMPMMRAQGYGKIVNIASGTVFKGTPGLAHYTASKGAIIALTRVLAREAGGDGVRINCLAPGFTLSEGLLGAASTETINTLTRASRCLQRDQQPEDLTGTLAYLLSSDSDFVTGQTMVVDGGSVMH